MKLLTEISGEKSEVVIEHAGSRVVAEIEGHRYDVDVCASKPGAHLLLSDGQVYECYVDHPGGKPESAEVTVGGRSYSIALTDPKRLRGVQGQGGSADGTAQIIALMPGKVVRVLIEPGAEVEAGAGLLVIEAMKMQNEMKSPKAGKVTTINVAEGGTVNAGDVLAVVE